MIFLGTILIAGLLFIINSISGILNILVFITQAIAGIIFALWYARIFLSYLVELREKEPEKKVGIPLGWAIFGIITCVINIIVWGFFSPLIFNFPKIYFLVPSALVMVEISYVFIKGNRRKARDWLIIVYNVFAFLYLFNWTLVDFGIDLPNILGIFSHTINSGVMWWQIVFVNTTAFFSPTFIFPIYMLNPRYYFAKPVKDYIKARAEIKKETLLDELKEGDKEADQSKLPGERTPFFEERRKLREQDEEIQAIEKELAKVSEEDDVKYAQHIGANDFPFYLRKFVSNFDSFLRIISLSIILVLIVVTPIVFVGNITMNAIPKHTKQTYDVRSNMVLAVQGNVFSTFDINGNLTSSWYNDLIKEIAWVKELHATHIRYDISSNALSNSATKGYLNFGLNKIQNSGLKLILSVAGDFVLTKRELLNTIYEDSIEIAKDFQPDYMIIFNEVNGELLSYVSEPVEIEEWFPAIINTTNVIKTQNPTTKVVTTILAIGDGIDALQKMLANSSLNLDAIGLIFYPVFFGWRLNKLLKYRDIYRAADTSLQFWISEIGMESFNFGEVAQAKFLSKIASMASNEDELNASGICITSLKDNLGYTINRGLTSHFGLVYYNERKKRAFEAISYAYGKILGII
ncbi:MAG: hypothetical protein HZR80_16125 [Candidatus Heimdallarchaeota archaeon]